MIGQMVTTRLWLLSLLAVAAMAVSSLCALQAWLHVLVVEILQKGVLRHGVCPNQCTPNVYQVIMCFKNLSYVFKLDLTVGEFFYFFEVRHYKKYAQARVCKAKLFDNLSQGDHVWHVDVLEVSRRWEAEVDDGPLGPLTYCDGTSYSIDMLQF
ncbi:unnamed protein product [Prunus armeniaca]